MRGIFKNTPQLKLKAAIRRQTPEEERHWQAVVSLLLTEIVRQHLRRQREKS